jgi:hypothetical protein
MKLASDVFDHLRRYNAQIRRIRIDQRMLAEEVHHAGNAARIGMNSVNGLRRENRPAGSPGHI